MIEQWIWPYPDGITDLGPLDLAAADPKMASVAELWRARRKELAQANSLKAFTERLDREFAIETNVIERVFRLDRGVTETLVEHGINEALIPHGSTDKPVQYVVEILRSALEATEWLTERFVRNSNPISTFSIKELHQLLTRHQLTTEAVSATGQQLEVPLLSGDYKKNDNQVRKGDLILRYCPPEHCAAQMEKLATLHQQHLMQSVPPEVSAAWLHHRLVQIHPFQDGNGRVARSLASLVFLKAGLFPVTVSRDQVARYIESLEAADAGNLAKLVQFFVDVQLQRFNQALNLSSDLQVPQSTVGLAVKSIGETLRRKQEEHAAQLRSVLQTANRLVEDAERHLQRVSQDVTAEGLDADTSRSSESNNYFYRGQAIGFARIHNYYADTYTYRSWVKIRFETEPATQLLLHFHCRGRDFIGVAVCAAIFEMIESAQDGGPAVRESIDIVLDPFEFYGTETQKQAKERFGIWLDQTIALALAQVQRFL